jgi:hypothetical protein
MVLCLLLIRQPGIAQVLQLPSPAVTDWKTGLLSSMGRAFQFAQVFEPAVITQQGNQVIVNGRSYPVAWSQRQNRIGVADTSLLQLIGIDLLSTGDVSKQPIEWFSDQRVNPIVLPTWRTGPIRYLDITDLPQHFSWQWWHATDYHAGCQGNGGAARAAKLGRSNCSGSGSIDAVAGG